MNKQALDNLTDAYVLLRFAEHRFNEYTHNAGLTRMDSEIEETVFSIQDAIDAIEKNHGLSSLGEQPELACFYVSAEDIDADEEFLEILAIGSKQIDLIKKTFEESHDAKLAHATLDLLATAREAVRLMDEGKYDDEDIACLEKQIELTTNTLGDIDACNIDWPDKERCR